MRCWSPFPESLLRLPRRMNSCRESRPESWVGACKPVSAQRFWLPRATGPFILKIIVIAVTIY